jgi:signal transduction histidine kinase
LKSFNQQLANANVTVTVDIPDHLPAVLADRMAIELVMDNLLDNAIRYSGEGKPLRIAARVEGEMVALDVIDQGRGIPEDELGQVTQKFFRGRSAGTGGSGLGLAIVKRIIRDHHGSLNIQSVVHRGTTITVAFPFVVKVEESFRGDDETVSRAVPIDVVQDRLHGAEKR